MANSGSLDRENQGEMLLHSDAVKRGLSGTDRPSEEANGLNHGMV